MRAHMTLAALLMINATACAKPLDSNGCKPLLEAIVNSDDVRRARNPLEEALAAIESKSPAECRGSNETFVGSRAYFLYGLGRINESEQLILQLEWKNSEDLMVLRTASMLITHERRLGGSLETAVELGRRVVQSAPDDPKSYLLLGESLIAQSRHAEAIEAYDEARSVRASRGLREVNGFDLNFIPSLFEQERHEDVLLLFDAASETPNFGLWERDSLILSALFAAEALGRREQAIRIVEEVEERRPDLAKKEHFQDVKQEILLLDPDAPLGEH